MTRGIGTTRYAKETRLSHFFFPALQLSGVGGRVRCRHSARMAWAYRAPQGDPSGRSPGSPLCEYVSRGVNGERERIKRAAGRAGWKF